MINNDHETKLWQVISRVDFYIETINSKASLLLAYCGALIFAVAVNIDKLKVADIYYLPVIIKIIFGAAIIFTIWAMIVLVQIVIPDLTKGRNPSSSTIQSLIFFGDIAETPSERVGYETKVEASTADDWKTDILTQTYAVSTVANSKFKMITKAGKLIIFGSLLPSGIGCFLLLIFANP